MSYDKRYWLIPETESPESEVESERGKSFDRQDKAVRILIIAAGAACAVGVVLLLYYTQP